ncbi:MAG: hypothetical protein IJ622_12575 [Bacteroidales bacterium]|nr:hypothetical protein [Bacteroidales bacterium]
MEKRNTESGWRYAKAIVNGVNGMVLFPDHWKSNCFPINYANDFLASYSSNVISAHDWEQVLEANGAVFLPASGLVPERETMWEITGSYGAYWSETRCEPWFCWRIDFDDEHLYTTMPYYPHARTAVRLVRGKEE